MYDRQPRIMRGQETALIAGERIIYTIRRSRRAKHMLLHVDVEGAVEVVVPWRVAWQQAEKFVRDKHNWLQEHLSTRQLLPRRSFLDGSSIPLFDQSITLNVARSPARRRAVALKQGGELRLALPLRGSVQRVVAQWYQRQARLFFTGVTGEFADIVGVTVKKISIGNHRTQWGSCSAKGRLSFNWRLLLGPQWIARYVAAHEVAHLVHHNHSAAYWETVATLYPEHKKARRWLREQAATLRW